MKKTRRGYSLVECLVVISLLAFTLAMVTLSLHGLRQGELNFRDELGGELAIERLVALLRQDTHQATAANLGASQTSTEAKRTLLLTIAENRTIEYSLGDDAIVRLIREGDQVRHRDSFAIPSASTGAWQIDTAGARPMVIVWLAMSQRTAKTELSRFCAVVGLENEQVK